MAEWGRRREGVTFNTSERPNVISVNALGNTDVLSWITNNSAQPHQYHFTLTKLAILLTTSASSRLNSYRQTWLSKKSSRGSSVINKAKTLHPFGINKRDEARQWHIWHSFNHSLPIIVTYFYLNFYCNGFLFTYFFPLSPWGRFVLQTEISGNFV